MRDDVRREFEKRIRDLPNERIEAEMEEWAYDSEERSILRRELEERRRAKDAPKERRHQELKRLHWLAAVVSLIGAAASWAAVWVQWHRSPPPATPANPLAAISPVPTPQESPAVTSPAPTPEELVPTLEESVPPPEESVPLPEESEESVPPPEESVPPPEESEESVPPPEEPPVTSPVPSPAEP
jgi:cytoskeletal protein RodZ